MSQQYTPLLSPKGQGPGGSRVGSDLHFWTWFCWIIVFLLLVSALWWVELGLDDIMCFLLLLLQ